MFSLRKYKINKNNSHLIKRGVKKPLKRKKIQKNKAQTYHQNKDIW
jgi:hypothetical protein